MAVRRQIVFARAAANLTHQSNRPRDCILNLESVVPRQAQIVARTGDQAGMDRRPCERTAFPARRSWPPTFQTEYRRRTVAQPMPI